MSSIVKDAPTLPSPASEGGNRSVPSLAERGQVREGASEISDAPSIKLAHFRDLWFHTGTACNLECPFCYEGSKPGDSRLERIALNEIKPLIDEAVQLGVERFGFTGGEPLIVKDIVKILSYALQFKPCLLLTNGTAPLIKRVHQLQLLKQQPHALSFRVSIDTPDEKEHDAGRGWGNFKRAIEGIKLLLQAGFEVGVVRRAQADEDAGAILNRFQQILNQHELPSLQITALPEFGRPGLNAASPQLDSADIARSAATMCATGRMVLKHAGRLRTYACPLTDDDERFDLGGALATAITAPVVLRHARCAQCLRQGACLA